MTYSEQTVEAALASSPNNLTNIFDALHEQYAFTANSLIRSFYYLNYKFGDDADLLTAYQAAKNKYNLHDVIGTNISERPLLAGQNGLYLERLALVNTLKVGSFNSIATCSTERLAWHIYYWLRKRAKLEAVRLPIDDMTEYIRTTDKYTGEIK
jgi:hypothetical protein